MKNRLPSSQFSSDVNVGLRLRELRAERHLSIRALADKSRLNVNTLSLIEHNKTSPSVSTLQQIATALQVPITAFFESKTPTQNISFHTASDRQNVNIPFGKLADLGIGFSRPELQPFLVTLEPKADSGNALIVHTGVEFVYCLEGCINYEIEGKNFTLHPDDSLLFEAHLPHRWSNAENGFSRFLLLLCPTEESDRLEERHFRT